MIGQGGPPFGIGYDLIALPKVTRTKRREKIKSKRIHRANGKVEKLQKEKQQIYKKKKR
jgi:hypothetical protein